jgi:hypothetical protein
MSALLQHWANGGATINTVAPDHYANGIPFDVDGTISVDTVGAVNHYHQGLPFTAVGRLAVTLADPDYYSTGCAGFNAGRLCVAEFGGSGDFAHGLNYVNGGVVVEPLAGGAVIDPPIDGVGVGFFDPPGRIDLSWLDNPLNDSVAVTYIVERDGQPDVEIAAPTVIYSDTRNLDPDVAYTHTIRTVNGDGTSAATTPINTAIPDLILWNEPTGLAVGIQSQIELRLTWVAPTIAGSFPIASYNIYRNTVLVANSGSTSLFFDDAPSYSETGFDYQVSAVDSDGNEGGLSAIVASGAWYGVAAVTTFDETGLVGTPVTSWNATVGGQVLDTVVGAISRGTQNSLSTAVTDGASTFFSAIPLDVVSPFSFVLVGQLEPFFDSGGDSFNFLTDSINNALARIFVLATPTNELSVYMAGTSGTGESFPVDNTVSDPHVFALTKSPTTLVNGFVDASPNTVNALSDSDFQGVRLFSDNNATRFSPVNSWVGEILVFNYELSTAQVEYWNDYLSSKWGI